MTIARGFPDRPGLRRLWAVSRNDRPMHPFTLPVWLSTALLLAMVSAGNAQPPPATNAHARSVIDGDRDGVPDARDACPESATGTVVSPYGCPLPVDQDRDGVVDLVDACPQSPPGAWVDGQGCALDADIDGVADGLDHCPGTRIGTRADRRGCASGDVVRKLPGPQPNRPVYAVAQRPPPGRKVDGSLRVKAIEEPSLARVQPRPLPVPEPAPAAPAPVPAGVSEVAAAPPTDAADRAAPGMPAADSSPDPGPEAEKSDDATRVVEFAAGRSEPGWRQKRQLRRWAEAWRQQLESDPLLQLSLSAHADITHDGLDAPRIARLRGEAVRDLLVDERIPAHRIQLRVAGFNEPRFGGPDMARNSRAELTLIEGPVRSMVGQRPSAPPLPTSAPIDADVIAVPFDAYSAQIDGRARAQLDRDLEAFLDPLRSRPASRIIVLGHTAAAETGGPVSGLALGRAAAVRTYLVSLGIPAHRVEVVAGTRGAGRRAELSLAEG